MAQRLFGAPVVQFVDSNGDPLASGTINTYDTGTTTNKATYTDRAGGTAHANPIVLDSNGAKEIWLVNDARYTFLVKNSTGTTQYTVDDISPIPESGDFTGLSDVVGDTTPQLGGNLDMNGKNLVSTSNADITITPNGTGTVVIGTDLDVDNININGNTIISTDTNGDINLTPNGTGAVVISKETVTTGTVTTLTSTDATVSGSLKIPGGAGGGTVNATGEITVDSTSKSLNYYDGAAEVVLHPQRSVSITVEDPGASEDISITFIGGGKAITISEMRAVLVGSSTPSVTWTIRHNTDRSAGGQEVVTSGTTTTSTTTGSDVTSFNDATVPLDTFLWLETTAQSGTVEELHVTITYTLDA